MIMDFAKHNKVNNEQGHIPAQGRVIRISRIVEEAEEYKDKELSQIKYGPQLWTM